MLPALPPPAPTSALQRFLALSQLWIPYSPLVMQLFRVLPGCFCLLTLVHPWTLAPLCLTRHRCRTVFLQLLMLLALRLPQSPRVCLLAPPVFSPCPPKPWLRIFIPADPSLQTTKEIHRTFPVFFFFVPIVSSFQMSSASGDGAELPVEIWPLSLGRLGSGTVCDPSLSELCSCCPFLGHRARACAASSVCHRAGCSRRSRTKCF